MACLQEEFTKRLKKHRWSNKQLNHPLSKVKRSDTNIKRSGQDLHELSPEEQSSCPPGKVYKKECQICFCNYKKEVVCSEPCKEKLSNQKTTSPIRTFPFPFTSTDILSFPALRSLSDKCEPGKMYRIDCNGCLCQQSNNLICEEKLCLSKQSAVKMEAEKLSGKKCNQDETHGCVKCICVDQMSECKVIPKCEEREKLTGHAAKVPLTLNPEKEKCKPGSMYTIQCNQCYCQSDNTLRCTQKACLNYAQAMKLKKQRVHLEQHGL